MCTLKMLVLAKSLLQLLGEIVGSGNSKCILLWKLSRTKQGTEANAKLNGKPEHLTERLVNCCWLVLELAY